MNEQQCIFDTSDISPETSEDDLNSSNQRPGIKKEIAFYASHRTEFFNVLAPYRISVDRLKLNLNKSYSTVMYRNVSVFTLKFGPKVFWIGVSQDEVSYLIKQNILFEPTANSNLIRIYLDDAHEADKYIDYLLDVLRRTIIKYPKPFSCCSRYMECSNARQCVNPDETLAEDCSYNFTLQSGRIFFGENRNID